MLFWAAGNSTIISQEGTLNLNVKCTSRQDRNLTIRPPSEIVATKSLGWNARIARSGITFPSIKQCSVRKTVAIINGQSHSICYDKRVVQDEVNAQERCKRLDLKLQTKENRGA